MKANETKQTFNFGGEITQEEAQKYTDLLNALESGAMYDFISCNSYRFGKQEIVKLLGELTYIVYSCLGVEKYEELQKQLKADLLSPEEVDILQNGLF